MRLKLHVIPVTQLFDEKARQMPVALSSVSWNKDSGRGIQDKMPFREIHLLRPRENGKISSHSTLHAAQSQCRRTSRNSHWRKTRCDQAPASQEFSARQTRSLHCSTSTKGCCLLHANTHSRTPTEKPRFWCGQDGGAASVHLSGPTVSRGASISSSLVVRLK